MFDAADLLSPVKDRNGDCLYDPCTIGLHLLGTSPDEGQGYTVLNLPAVTHADAQAMFDRARAVAECDEDAADFCCDLNLGGTHPYDVSHVDDFWTNRQLVPALIRAALASQGNETDGGGE